MLAMRMVRYTPTTTVMNNASSLVIVYLATRVKVLAPVLSSSGAVPSASTFKAASLMMFLAFYTQTSSKMGAR